MKKPNFAFALREDIKNDKRFLPTRAEPKATGWDVRAAMPDKAPLVIKPFQYVKIPLGFRAFCPDGWWFKLYPRSSSFAKKSLHALYGVIDELFEGEMVFACQYIPEFEIVLDATPQEIILFNNAKPLVINWSDAIGQIIPVERQEMKVIEWSNEDYDNACKTRAGARGAGGFGSTS